MENRSSYWNLCELKLSTLCTRVELRGKLNILDFHLHAEDFYLNFLNVLFGYSLKNINQVTQNSEGIDLIDDTNKLVLQVSSTATKAKVESALSKDLAVYKGYRFNFVSISKDASELRKQTFINPHGLTFSPQSDIHDVKSILSHILHLKIEDQRVIYDFLQKELKPDEDQPSTESNLAAVINTNHLFPGHYGKKPTFPQIISHNIRYKEISLTNTLRTLNQYTRDDEYETLYLFLLGCDFDQGNTKQNLLAQIRTETSFKTRLESTQTKSAYETALELLLDDIVKLNEKKSSLRINPNFESDIKQLDEVKYKINLTSTIISRLKLRYSLIIEAMNDIKSNHFQVDISQLKMLYNDATGQLSKVHKSFEDLVNRCNRVRSAKKQH